MKKIVVKIIVSLVIIAVAAVGFIITSDISKKASETKIKESTTTITSSLELTITNQEGYKIVKQINHQENEILGDLLKRVADSVKINNNKITEFSIKKNNSNELFTITETLTKTINIYIDDKKIDSLDLLITKAIKKIELKEE